MDGARDGNLRRELPFLQRATGDTPGMAHEAKVVAAVYSPLSLRAAEALRAAPDAAPDLLELRLDHFAHNPGFLETMAAAPPRPLVVTVRRSDEGGGPPHLDHLAREALYRRFLPKAALVDVEVRSLGALAGVVAEARAGGVGIIASFHDFQGMPGVDRLHDLAGQAADAGADVLKVAAVTETTGDLARLLDFLATETRLPLALMGMGRLGIASRVVLAAAGSVLAYGYLGEQAQVPGQWPAGLLRERIRELAGTVAG